MDTARTLAYGTLGLPLAFAALPVYVHVPHFYAAVSGLPLPLVGGILLGARLLDAGIDPCLGWLADRVPRRRMLLLSLPPFAAGFFALMNPPIGATSGWLLGTLVLTYFGFSASTVAYQAWGADVGTNTALRTRMTASREGFGLVGVMLAASLPGLMSTNLAVGISRLGWIMPPMLLIAAVIAFSWGRAGPTVVASQRPLWSSIAGACSDSVFRRLLIVFVANGIAAALPATLFLFFVDDVLQAGSSSGLLLAIYFLSGAISLPLWVKLSSRLGRGCAWLGSMLLATLAFAGTVFLGTGDLWPFTAVCVATGISLGADLALPAAIAADIGERLEQAGACFGIWNFVAKLTLALAAGLSLPLLDRLGYRPGTDIGLPALSICYALLPLGFKAIAGTLLWRWRHALEVST